MPQSRIAARGVVPKKYDLVVVGGGTAGAPAAIAASRLGLRTLIVEQLTSLGGTQTEGWVTPMMPNYLGDFKLNRGINLEINERMATKNEPDAALVHGDVWYDPLTLAVILDEMAKEAGVDCLFGASLFSVKCEQGRIRSAKILCRNQVLSVEADQWIDASGDAALSTLAGAEVVSGNEEGDHQPLTLRFFMGNVDIPQLRSGLEIWRTNTGDYLEAGFAEAKESPIAPWINEAITKGILLCDDLGYFQVFTIVGRPCELAFNCPRITDLDPMEPAEFSQAFQSGRAKIRRIAEFVKTFFPGCKSAFVSGVATMMGIRESRRVVGEYCLTEQDHALARKFSDPIARNRYPVDIHLNKGIRHETYPPGEFHDIPYRCLVAKDIKNLWVAGRCTSADFVAQSAIRIQPVCRAMGEAAGIAAALCHRHRMNGRDLPYDLLAPFLDLSLPN